MSGPGARAKRIGGTAAAPATVTAVCMATAIVEGFDIQAMGAAAPAMIPALGLTPGQAGWAFSASLFGLMAGAVIGGFIADAKGRRPVLIVSTLLFGLMTLATAFTRDFALLLAVRFAVGLGLGGAMPMILAISAERSAEGPRIGTVALAAAGIPLGGALAGLLARLAVGPGSWQTIFVVGGIAAVLLALVQLWLLPETRPPAKSREEAVPVRVSRAGATLLGLTWLSIGLSAMMSHLMLNWLPTLLIGKGAPPEAGVDALILFNLGGIFGAVAIGRWSDRAGFRWPLAAACLAAALVLTALAGAGSVGATSALGLLAGICLVGLQFTLLGAASTFFAGPTRGRGVGSSVAAGRLGAALGPVFAGQLLAFGFLPADVFRFMAAIAIATALSVLLLSLAAPKAGRAEQP